MQKDVYFLFLGFALHRFPESPAPCSTAGAWEGRAACPRLRQEQTCAVLGWGGGDKQSPEAIVLEVMKMMPRMSASP